MRNEWGRKGATTAHSASVRHVAWGWELRAGCTRSVGVHISHLKGGQTPSERAAPRRSPQPSCCEPGFQYAQHPCSRLIRHRRPNHVLTRFSAAAPIKVSSENLPNRHLCAYICTQMEGANVANSGNRSVQDRTTFESGRMDRRRRQELR